jgi:hypothetical protein
MRHEVRRFPTREVAIGQGATDAWPAGSAERPRPKDWMGRLAAGPIGPKVKEKFFSE